MTHLKDAAQSVALAVSMALAWLLTSANVTLGLGESLARNAIWRPPITFGKNFIV